MPFPDALQGNPKIIFFSDFDGTVSTRDSKTALSQVDVVQ